MLRERMFAVVTSAYGLVTLALVGVGLYGLMTFLVASRTREIGIRIAVGAERADVLWLVAREVLLVSGVGLAFGISGAAAGTKLVTTYLFGVRALEPAVLALTALALALIGAVAAFAPVRRALALLFLLLYFLFWVYLNDRHHAGVFMIQNVAVIDELAGDLRFTEVHAQGDSEVRTW